jgi:membrane-bound lytic murein transglycosylase D
MTRSIFLCIAALFFSAGLKAQHDSILFKDDPVAAMLDSLARNSYITKIPRQPVQASNKFNYAPDSVPACIPAVVETRLAKLDAQSPFDFVYNDQVAAYINLYAIRRRNLVEKMLGLSQLYYPLFEERLDKYNLPLELKHLAVVESALNPTATSPAGARGLWQFMYSTGVMYNLNVNSYVDERCDPYKSTEAACQFLEDLYRMFGDWQMVLAAYNAGPGTVNKAIRRAGGGKKTYWEIRSFLPRETQAYVPAFIAATYVMNYHAEHNLYANAPRKVFFDVDTVAIRQQVTFTQLQSVLDMSYDELEFLNPMYKLGVVPLSVTDKPYNLVLPVNKVGTFVTNEHAIYNYIKTDTAMASLEIKQVKKTHVVKKGETITTIARKYKCSVTDVRAWNGLKSNYLKPGQKLVIYLPEKMAPPATTEKPSTAAATTTKPPATTTTTAATTSTDGYKYYTVKKGDSLYLIAKKTGTNLADLKKLNGLTDKSVLHVGQKIKIAKI